MPIIFSLFLIWWVHDRFSLQNDKNKHALIVSVLVWRISESPGHSLIIYDTGQTEKDDTSFDMLTE